MADLMPETRVYEVGGVKMTFLTYDTLKSFVVETVMRRTYERPAPTPENPNARGIPNEAWGFSKAMPALISVELPGVPPRWAVMLKTMIDSHDWLEDPVKDFKQIERFAPPETLYNTTEGYYATREKVMAAPDDLKSPLIPVDEFDDTLTDEEKVAKKKTSSGAGPSSTPRSSNAHERRSAAPTRTRR